MNVTNNGDCSWKPQPTAWPAARGSRPTRITSPVFDSFTRHDSSRSRSEALSSLYWLLNCSTASWNITKTAPSLLFPTYVPLLNDPSYKDLNNPLSGTSDPNVAFTGAASNISPDQWPPFMTEALNEASTVFASVQDGKGTLQSAFTNFQNVLVSYAKAQGFTVNT